jgi:hypothetical protein
VNVLEKRQTDGWRAVVSTIELPRETAPFGHGSVEHGSAVGNVVCGAYFMLPHTVLLSGYLLATGLAAAAAFSSARRVRVFSRNAIFCFLSLLKRAVSPQVFDI